MRQRSSVGSSLARRTAGKVLLALALVPALAGLSCCATPSFSYLDGERWSRSELNTYDTLIVSIDGTSYSYNSQIRVEPGRHHIVFETNPIPGFDRSPQKALDIDIEPCQRYWFEAKRVNRGTQDFEPRVNYKESIVGCGIASNSGSRY